jgi:hypothetical protein
MSAQTKRRLCFWAVFALGLGIRLWQFGRMPEGINQDEAFAGYEAFCLLHGGMDTAGYRFPVYLTAWGSGMNALESYLMLPFAAVFGLKTWVVRMPQLLTGLLSLPAAYGVACRARDERQALVTMLLFAICPWHVLLCRWGLESNLAPGFLLFGLYFFVRALEDSRFFWLCGLFTGLSLYAYATIWPFVPLMLGLSLLYCGVHDRLRFDRRLLGGGLILALLALPLLLFLAVNFGLIAEIRTPFFSVPKLLYMRSGELSFRHIPENLRNLFTILWKQSDGLPWNYAGPFGLLYPLSVPFALLGLLSLLARRVRSRDFDPMALMLFQLLVALLLGALVSVNVNRVNILFPPLIFLTAEGISRFCERFRVRLLPLLLAAYLLCFGLFARYYFTDYKASLRTSFAWGLEDALAAAERHDGTIVLSGDVYYPDVLFYAQTDPDVFRATVRYQNYPAAFLRAASFDRFRFGLDGAPEDGCVYLLSPWSDTSVFTEADYETERYGFYTLAYRK